MAEPAAPRATWGGSDVDEGLIAELRQLGCIPPTELVLCRVPREGKVVPVPLAGEWVVFASHLVRGFGLPASPFLRSFLDHFGIQMQHLPMNGVLFFSAYVTDVEAYLGLHPTVAH